MNDRTESNFNKDIRLTLSNELIDDVIISPAHGHPWSDSRGQILHCGKEDISRILNFNPEHITIRGQPPNHGPVYEMPNWEFFVKSSVYHSDFCRIWGNPDNTFFTYGSHDLLRLLFHSNYIERTYPLPYAYSK